MLVIQLLCYTFWISEKTFNSKNLPTLKKQMSSFGLVWQDMFIKIDASDQSSNLSNSIHVYLKLFVYSLDQAGVGDLDKLQRAGII